MSEWCKRAFYATGLFTWIKLHHCSFATIHVFDSEKDANGDYKWKKPAVTFNGRTDGNSTAGHIVMDDVRVWHSYENAIQFANVNDIMLTDVSVDGYQPKVYGSALNSALIINGCKLIRGSGLKLSAKLPNYSNKKAYNVGDWCYYSNTKKFYICNTAIPKNPDSKWNDDGENFVAGHWTESSDINTKFNNSLYLYVAGTRGFAISNVVCNGFTYEDTSRARLSFTKRNSDSMQTKFGRVTNIVGDHPFTYFKYETCHDVVIDTPAAGKF